MRLTLSRHVWLLFRRLRSCECGDKNQNRDNVKNDPRFQSSTSLSLGSRRAVVECRRRQIIGRDQEIPEDEVLLIGPVGA
jgi:hypothetical protein